MMKTLYLVLVVLLLAVAAAAQVPSSPPDAPGVAVIKTSWRRQVHNPALDEDPFHASREQAELERARKATIKENDVRADLGQERLPLPSRAGAPRAESGGPTIRYVYEAKISNTGDKAIRKLVWEYALLDPATGRDVGQHRFTSEVSIRPGKSKTLVGHSASPAARVVDASKAGKETQRGQYTERVVIHRIEYDDGSAWERASN